MEYLGPRLAQGNRLTEALMVEASREPTNDAERYTPEPSVFKAVEALTKGIEIPLPDPHFFIDKDGHQRRRVRTCWWNTEAENVSKGGHDGRRRTDHNRRTYLFREHVRLGGI